MQERDSAGNWSSDSTVTLEIDTCAPLPPILTEIEDYVNSTELIISWQSSVKGAGVFVLTIDEQDPDTLESTTLTITLSEGKHIIQLQEKNNNNAWSAATEEIFIIDTF